MNVTGLYANFQNLLFSASLHIFSGGSCCFHTLTLTFHGVRHVPFSHYRHLASCSPCCAKSVATIYVLSSFQQCADLSIWYEVLSCTLCPYWCVFLKFLRYDFRGIWAGNRNTCENSFTMFNQKSYALFLFSSYQYVRITVCSITA